MATKGPKAAAPATSPKPRARRVTAGVPPVEMPAALAAEPEPAPAPVKRGRPAKTAAPVAMAEPVSAPVAKKPVAKKPTPPAAAPVPAPEIAPAPVVVDSADPVPADPVPAADIAATAVETSETLAAPVVDAVTDPVAAEPAIPPAAKKEYFAMTNTIETMTEKSQAMIAEMNDRAKTAMEKSAKIVEEMNEFAKGNVEAVVESGRITAKGLETLGQDAAEFSRKSFESATAAMKSLASVKSPTEFMKLQSDFARQAFDAFVAETSKTTEAVIKLAGDAAQPISSRVAVATDKMKVAA